jgi:two-component system sensor histidine kinase QseC
MIRSLRRRLTALTLGCIAFVMLPLLAITYAKVVEEVNELSDARLAQSAKTLEALSTHLGLASGNSPIEVTNWFRPKGANEASPQGHGYETQIGFQYWNTASQLELTTQDLRDLPFGAAPVGFSDVVKDKRKWRIYTKIGDNGGFVRAAERYDSRREIIRDLILQSVAPLVVGLPILALLMGWAIKRGLTPLSNIAQRIEARSPEETLALDAHDAPDEIAPLVGALNGLLQRLRRLIENERQFTANAAHELRTPLAGALIHVENAIATSDPNERASAFADIRGALNRMTRLVNQMLDLARWDSASATKAMTEVDLARCVDDELGSFASRIAERNIHVVRSAVPTVSSVRGWEVGIRILVRNIIDNAVRYGAIGGALDIELACDGEGILLAITNSGPAIEATLRDAMFDRFQRGFDPDSEGVGLGLSIAKRIAELHRASVRLLDPRNGEGLRVEVRFPRYV